MTLENPEFDQVDTDPAAEELLDEEREVDADELDEDPGLDEERPAILPEDREPAGQD